MLLSQKVQNLFSKNPFITESKKLQTTQKYKLNERISTNKYKEKISTKVDETQTTAYFKNTWFFMIIFDIIFKKYDTNFSAKIYIYLLKSQKKIFFYSQTWNKVHFE